jgi:hypothetical protein
VRETLIQALTAIDRILPPLDSTQPALCIGGNDAKLSTVIDPHAHTDSPASGSMYDQGQPDRKGNPKVEGGEGSTGFESSGQEEVTSPQSGHGTSQLQNHSRKPSPATANMGESSPQGVTGAHPWKPLTTATTTSEINPSNHPAKRSRNVSGTSSPSAGASGSQPTRMAMAPAATMYGTPSYTYLLPRPLGRPLPPTNHHLPSYGPMPGGPGGQDPTQALYQPLWDPRAVHPPPPLYMMSPAYQPSEGAPSQEYMTPSPHSAERQVQSWQHGPSPVSYHPQNQHLTEGGRGGGLQHSLAGSMQSDHLPQPSPHHEYRAGVVRHAPRSGEPAYDPSCYSGLFDCSSMPPPMRPVVHEVTIASGPAAAAAPLSFEQSAPASAPSSAPPTWSRDQRSMQMQQQQQDQGQSRDHLTATTTVQWQEWDPRVGGTGSTTTSDGAPRLELPSA